MNVSKQNSEDIKTPIVETSAKIAEKTGNDTELGNSKEKEFNDLLNKIVFEVDSESFDQFEAAESDLLNPSPALKKFLEIKR